MTPLPLARQNAYIDLLERLRDDQVAALGREPGNFVLKTVNGRRYWYHQYQDPARGRVQVSVGPETPELLARIERHRALVSDERARRDLVRSLTRGGGVTGVPGLVGETVSALADAGVFRLRAVLVGTVAFATYGPMLGARFGRAALSTEDGDVAQFRSFSIAVEDRIPPLLDVLRRVDASFEPMTKALHDPQPIAFRSASGMKIEFLTPMRGRHRDEPVRLPALDTSSQALRFLDYLIYRERQAALLYGPGVLVNVPEPARYAWHKLIISRRRSTNREKARKDVLQAEMLFDALLAGEGRGDILDMWTELAGPERVRWQDFALAGLGHVREEVRSSVLEIIGRTEQGQAASL